MPQLFPGTCTFIAVIPLAVSASLLLLLDQWTKRMVVTHVGLNRIELGSVLRIHYVVGRKASWSWAGTPAVLASIWLIALVCALVLQRSGAWFQSQFAIAALGFAFGGSASNLLDLVRRRHVVDFIDLRWWPVFNLADVAIVGGLVLALWPRG